MIESTLINRQALLDGLNTNLHKYVDSSSPRHAIKKVAARGLLTSDRFDLLPKLIYAEDRLHGWSSKWARAQYLAHINCINGFVENDNTRKVGPEAFVESFDTLIDGMRAFAFKRQFPIPVARGGILDGAHRVAAAIALKQDVWTVEVAGAPSHSIGHDQLSVKGLDAGYVEASAAKYAEICEDSRLIFIWPTADGKEQQLLDLLGQHGSILFRKDVMLSQQGQRNLIRTVYRDERWLGTEADGYIGVENKTRWCFQGRGPVRIFLFKTDGDWLLLKERVRALFSVEKNSIHINDSHAETIDLARLVFNQNGVNYLNGSLAISYGWSAKLVTTFEEWIRLTRSNPEEFCIVGSSVMSVYGLREARDLDFVTCSKSPQETGFKEIDCHNSEIAEYGLDPREIVLNPGKHFWFFGRKIMSLKLLSDIKSKRGEDKDKVDLGLIGRALDGLPPDKTRRPVTVAVVKGKLKFQLLKCRFHLKRLLSTFARKRGRAR